MKLFLLNSIEMLTLSKLAKALLFSSIITTSQVLAEEAPISADVPVSKQELMQQAADGEVSVPRVRKFVKPNRMLMHESVVNSKAGFSFLDENSRKSGVIKLKSGLQYKVLKAGAGGKPKEEDIVSCAYKGSLIDGTVFEQSELGKPAAVKVAPLTAGLKEAIKLMTVGSKWEVYIPSELGFGSAGKSPKVGPDAVLVYNLELFAINPAPSK